MPKPFHVTTATPHGMEPGYFIHFGSGGMYRVVEVVSPTEIRVDRPRWLPLYSFWLWVTLPFRRAYSALRSLWP